MRTVTHLLAVALIASLLELSSALTGLRMVGAADRLVPIYQPRKPVVSRPNQYLYACRINCPPSSRSLKRYPQKSHPVYRGQGRVSASLQGDQTRLLPTPQTSPRRDRLAETRPEPVCAPGYRFNPKTLHCQRQTTEEN